MNLRNGKSKVAAALELFYTGDVSFKVCAELSGLNYFEFFELIKYKKSPYGLYYEHSKDYKSLLNQSKI